MFDLILFEPEIPPNTGNVIRLCANTGVALHLIEPLGFELEERKLRRAGLDYREFASMQTHSSLDDCLTALGQPRVFALSTRGKTRHDVPHFKAGDAFLLGPETRGLPQSVQSLLHRLLLGAEIPLASETRNPHEARRHTRCAARITAHARNCRLKAPQSLRLSLRLLSPLSLSQGSLLTARIRTSAQRRISASEQSCQ